MSRYLISDNDVIIIMHIIVLIKELFGYQPTTNLNSFYVVLMDQRNLLPKM